MELEEMGSLDPVEVRLNHLLGFIYSSHRISMWAFSAKSGQLFFCSALHEKELLKLFEMSGCREYAFGEARDLTMPFMMSGRFGMIWLGEYVTLGNGGRLLVLLGPVFYASASREYLEALPRTMVSEGAILHSEIDTYRKTLSEVPVVPAQSFIACARALHFTIHKKALATVDIHFQTELLREENGPKETASRSWIDYELLHGQEELLLQCVRDGNLNYKKVLAGLNFSVLDLPLAGNPLRSEANKVASGGALFRRAAIEGGLSPKVALDLENQYLFRADKLRTVTELRSLTIEMLEDFIRHVHEAKQQGACSRQIRECCEYIDNHLTEDLSVQRIAKEIGYTEYYLTRKFQKEMKIRMSEYIKDARLEYAKVCLLSTQMSIEEIGDLLQFNSRSYFTKTFREKTGKSPSEYRAGKEGGA